MSENGKGSKRRPAAVPQETLAERWERTFGRVEPEPKPEGRGA